MAFAHMHDDYFILLITVMDENIESIANILSNIVPCK